MVNKNILLEGFNQCHSANHDKVILTRTYCTVDAEWWRMSTRCSEVMENIENDSCIYHIQYAKGTVRISLS